MSAELEHLITRYLDREATPAERRTLRVLRRDPAVDALVDEYAALDQAAGAALRATLGRPWLPVVVARGRLGRLGAFAAAAAIALLVWVLPPGGKPPRSGVAQAGTSWFTPAGPAADAAEAPGYSFDRPRAVARDTQRDWIIVPGNRPNEYLIIEVDRVHTRARAIQIDF